VAYLSHHDRFTVAAGLACLSESTGCRIMQDSFRIDSFNATAREIGLADRDLLLELTIGVFWPHRAQDIELFMQLGHGYLAIDEIGRAMGSTMCFAAEDDFAMVGMMVTAPRLQTLGAGRWLLERTMQDCDGRDLRLSATRSGYRLYEGAGFVPLGRIWQQQGRLRAIRPPAASPGVTVRDMAAEDRAAIFALDATAYGARRCRTLDGLLGVSAGVVAEQGGQIIGYALRRSFGRGQVIGPVVAEEDRVAMQLTAALMQGQEGQFLRVDTHLGDSAYSAFLAAAGLGIYDTVTEMYFGAQRRPLSGMQMFGMAAQSLG